MGAPAAASSLRLGTLPPINAAPTRGGRLGYILSGSGPSIVLLSGAGVSLEGWRALYPDIESLGTVFAWNRFGVKGSDPPAQAQTGAVVVAALRELLAQVKLPAPYLLVGHSLGGLHANLFARLYPREVAAVMLVEATHPDERGLLRRHEDFLAQALGKVLGLPEAMFRENLHAELKWTGETARQLQAAGPFPDVPLTVVTGGQPAPPKMMSPGAAGARRAHQQALARLSPRGVQVIAHDSGHFPQLTEPQLVLAELGRLVRCTTPAAI